MHSFEVNERGLEIVQQNGLDELARRISDSDATHPLLDLATSESWDLGHW